MEESFLLGAPAVAESSKTLHVFLDNSPSMKFNDDSWPLLRTLFGYPAGPTRMERAKPLFEELYPMLQRDQARVHLVGGSPNEEASRRSRELTVDLSAKKQLLEQWRADGRGTYLWEYVYEQVKDLENAEVIIVTDGDDNRSSGAFRGPWGFKRGAVAVSMCLVGGEFSRESAGRYRDLCMASGGFFFHHSSSAAADGAKAEEAAQRDFVRALTLPDEDRKSLSQEQQRQYASLRASGEAVHFDWAVQ